MRDTKHLELRYQTWHCVKDVPRPLRKAMGKRRLVVSLRTHDLRVAQARRYEALAAFQRQINEAAKGVEKPVAVAAGLGWREVLAALKAGDREQIANFGGREVEEWVDGELVVLSPQVTAIEVAEGLLGDQAEAIARDEGPRAAGAFLDLALRRATPLLHYVDAWLAEGGSKGPTNPRTQGQYRSDMTALEAWLHKAGLSPTIEAVTKPIAGRYVTEGLVGIGMNRLTANRKISTASSYWTWLGKRTEIETNPWRGQSLAKGASRKEDDDGKRAFTEGELAKLLGGDADAELADAIRVSALSGMRLDELYRLRVSDCADGWFWIREAKTRAGRRRVPIHSALAALVARRIEGKAVSDFLFDEPGPRRPGRERSMAVSKRFGTYRQRLGVHERAEGRRQSAVDFHSLRRSFVTKARNGGIDRAVVAAVVGHEAGNITDDIYSAGPTEERMKACVEAVKLPEAARAAAPELSPATSAAAPPSPARRGAAKPRRGR